MQRAAIACAFDVPGRRTAILVPTRAAAAELRRTIENVLLLRGGQAAVLMPDLLTRGDLYARLAERLPGAPPLLTAFEREVLFRLAARATESAGVPAPFRLRPALIAEILAFYDELRRSHRTLDDFYRHTAGELSAVAESDRGAERLLRQAEFLAAAFGELERRTSATGRVDEHGLRALLLEQPAMPPYDHVVAAVGDQAADAHGLWTADFDLLARIPGLERLDVLATERLLATGFYERLHERLLPGIEDAHVDGDGRAPALEVPAGPPGHAPLVHTCRDREEELVGVARSIKQNGASAPLDRTAVVFQRPLPYLYLARQVFGSAHIPYQATDALPLAGEPFAAAIDLLLSFIAAEGTRASAVALLRSPHWSFVDPDTGDPIERTHVAALDALLRDVKFLGGWDQLASPELRSRAERARGAASALRAAVTAAHEVTGAVRGDRATVQIDALRQFIASHERLPHDADPWQQRHLRARAAILAGLTGLRDAHERHDDTPLPFVELAAAVRRWIEDQTFAPRTGASGLLLVDAAAAPFADVDVARIVGLVDGDWPERAGKSIFFPPRMLEPLGWPSPVDRLAAARARFQDLLRLPARAVSVSTFSLEDDAIVAASAFVEDVGASGLAVQQTAAQTRGRIFDHEALSMEPLDAAAATGDAAAWLELRRALDPADAPRFHGAAGRRAPDVYAVSRVERYLECPFKYFAAHVLRLDEERAEESGLTPQERGVFLHAVFERFFSEWRAAGRGAITADTLEDALAMFERVGEAHLATLPERDRALERTYLLGSAVAPGLGERAFAFEIEHGIGVAERLLEHVLDGTFVFLGTDGPREVRLRAKADRIDLLEDGTLRIVDYKIGRAPKLSRALQLPVYSVCASQGLAGDDGRDRAISRAGYVAFREKNAFVAVGQNLEKALADGQQRFLRAVDGIEEGSFPPRPDEPWLCTRCGYAMVCRKDYVGDD